MAVFTSATFERLRRIKAEPDRRAVATITNLQVGSGAGFEPATFERLRRIKAEPDRRAVAT
ncbi:MAG: hypothetical protein LJE85_13635, partial [Gammaproteobacteria bacterium]|nr:hypothetical protein [Gammaproteobacteria bacterium]